MCREDGRDYGEAEEVLPHLHAGHRHAREATHPRGIRTGPLPLKVGQEGKEEGLGTESKDRRGEKRGLGPNLKSGGESRGS